MKVILLRDVAKVGRKNDVVDVPNGYGMNKLIPQGMAKPATVENLKAIEQQTAKTTAAATESAEQFQQLLEALADKPVVVTAEANEEGRLFKAVNATEVAQALSETAGIKVGEEQVILGDPIKQLGECVVTLASGPDSRKQTLTVVAK